MYEFSNQLLGGGGDYSPSLSYDPSSAFNVEPSMGYSFNPNSFMDYSFEPDYSFDQDYSFDPFMDDSYSGVDPVALAGLGLGGGFVSSQTGGAPAIQASQVPTQNGTLIGVPDFNAPYIYPEAARAFKGVEFNMPFNPLDPNPQISATIDEPVKNAQFSGTSGISYSPFGGLGTSSTTDTGQLRLNNFIDNLNNQNQRMAQSSYSPFGGISTTSTALQNRSGFGGKVEDVAGRVLSNLSDEAIMSRLAAASGSLGPEPVKMATPEPVSNLSVNGMNVVTPVLQMAAAQSQAAPGSPQAFFEEYRSRGPLTPEQIARGEAEAARIGTTFDPETGFSRESFLQSQQVQAPQFNGLEYGYRGSAPMSIEETRARLGGRTLNQYLDAPSGTEGVYGLRTDPQGRMISTREGEQATGELSDYEKASAERYARMDERKRRPGESRTQRDTRLAQGAKEQTLYGGYTEPQLRDLFGQQNLRAAKAKASAGIDPLTNERLSDERREQYDNALKTKILEERLTNYREEDPDAFEKARVLVEKLIQSKQIAPQDGNQYMLRALNLDKKDLNKGGESALMKMILSAGRESEGNAGGSKGRSDIPQDAIDALRGDPSRASEFDKYFGQGSSAQFL
jgi:hypothetical protein